MTTLNRQQARNVDQHAIDKFGISGQILMENAGRACTDVIEVQPVNSVILLCGKGNNAGDGFVIARHLLVREIPAITILLAAGPSFTYSVSQQTPGPSSILRRMALLILCPMFRGNMKSDSSFTPSELTTNSSPNRLV